MARVIRREGLSFRVLSTFLDPRDEGRNLTVIGPDKDFPLISPHDLSHYGQIRVSGVYPNDINTTIDSEDAVLTKFERAVVHALASEATKRGADYVFYDPNLVVWDAGNKKAIQTDVYLIKPKD